MTRDLNRAGDSEPYDAMDSIERLRACEGQGPGPAGTSGVLSRRPSACELCGVEAQ